jgi:hypothetical protein
MAEIISDQPAQSMGAEEAPRAWWERFISFGPQIYRFGGSRQSTPAVELIPFRRGR